MQKKSKSMQAPKIPFKCSTKKQLGEQRFGQWLWNNFIADSVPWVDGSVGDKLFFIENEELERIILKEIKEYGEMS
jgi:hypothetical protein